MSVLDKIDRSILEQLLTDGRASFSNIAKEIGLTDVAIKKRFERLKKKGILNAVKADINLKSIGFENIVLLQIRSDLSKQKDIERKLLEMDPVIELTQVLGEYNLIAKLALPNLNSAQYALTRIGLIDGVLEVKSSVVLDQLKDSFCLPAQALQKTL
ncbi:MAG: Lrp/AsnC family transcriptional regulator [archaeon]